MSSTTSFATSSNQNQTTKPTQITAKSEVSQSTAISDRPKAKPNSRKKLQQKLLQQQLQQQSENAVSISRKRKDVKNNLNKIDVSQASQTPPSSTNATNSSSAILSDSKSSSSNATSPQTKSENVDKVEATEQEVPQTVPEASSTSDDQKEQKAPENCSGARSCSLIDLETFQKMRLNNLSNRSAYWDPKVFRKIAQIIDPPKSPTETPPESSQSSRPNSPDVKSLASKFYFTRNLFQLFYYYQITFRRRCRDESYPRLSSGTSIVHSRLNTSPRKVCKYIHSFRFPLCLNIKHHI